MWRTPGTAGTVVPPTVCSYAQVVTSSPLDGADWVYVESGVAKPMAGKHSGPYRVLECGNKAWTGHVGKSVDILSRDRLKPHLGSEAPKAPVPPGRPRMASVASVASSPSATKPGGPVY